MATRSDVKEAKIHKPEESFAEPGDVVVDPQLSLKEKKKALETLEQDAHELSTASNEGMASERDLRGPHVGTSDSSRPLLAPSGGAFEVEQLPLISPKRTVTSHRVASL